MTRHLNAAGLLAVPLALTFLVMLLVVMGGGQHSTTAGVALVPTDTTLNTSAVPAWAVGPLTAAARTCPEATAPLLAAQIQTESSWDPTQYNPGSQAAGLAQFIPATWATFGRDGDGDGHADPYNPLDAILSQAGYLCYLVRFVQHTSGLTGEAVDLALAAYNAGPSTVQRFRGIPPFAETTHYVTTIRTLAASTYAAVSASPDDSSLAGRVIQAAAAHVGRTMYAWGGGTLDGPSRGMPPDHNVIGFDCSALVRYAYYQGSNHAITLPRTAQQQHDATRDHPVSIRDLRSGDLLFWGTPTAIHHVALYIGNNRMIEAPQSGQPITETALRTDGDYLGATRVVSRLDSM
jgi:cell wall-associated NlpC family hydrolase